MFNLFNIFGQPRYKGQPTLGTVRVGTKSTIEAEWRNINVLVTGKQPSQLRQALISADKTLDNALRDVVVGENMGERLKNARTKFDRDLYDKIWKAHKMRNALVHESGYEPPHHMILKGIGDLKRALLSLGVRI